MTAEQFTEGLTRIALATRANVEAAAFAVYHDALDGETTGEEWGAFCKNAVSTGRFSWFPKVGELLDALREFRGEPSLEVEAIAAYEAVMKAGAYTPDGGSSWTWRGVLESCGRAAADAWLEAGGHHAFATTWNEDKRRERFIAAYQQNARAEPATRLLLDGERKALPAPLEHPTRDESAAILRQIVERAN